MEPPREGQGRNTTTRREGGLGTAAKAGQTAGARFGEGGARSGAMGRARCAEVRRAKAGRDGRRGKLREVSQGERGGSGWAGTNREEDAPGSCARGKQRGRKMGTRPWKQGVARRAESRTRKQSARRGDGQGGDRIRASKEQRLDWSREMRARRELRRRRLPVNSMTGRMRRPRAYAGRETCHGDELETDRAWTVNREQRGRSRAGSRRAMELRGWGRGVARAGRREEEEGLGARRARRAQGAACAGSRSAVRAPELCGLPSREGGGGQAGRGSRGAEEDKEREMQWKNL